MIDSSARPAWVAIKTYWELAYPEIKLPEIKFVNPRGFISQEDHRGSTFNSSKIWEKYDRQRVDNPGDPNTFRTTDDIVKELKKVTNKDQAILLVDECMHVGDNMMLVKSKLELAGIDGDKIHVAVGLFSETSDQIEQGIPAHLSPNLAYSNGSDEYGRPLLHDIFGTGRIEQVEIDQLGIEETVRRRINAIHERMTKDNKPTPINISPVKTPDKLTSSVIKQKVGWVSTGDEAVLHEAAENNARQRRLRHEIKLVITDQFNQSSTNANPKQNAHF